MTTISHSFPKVARWTGIAVRTLALLLNAFVSLPMQTLRHIGYGLTQFYAFLLERTLQAEGDALHGIRMLRYHWQTRIMAHVYLHGGIYTCLIALLFLRVNPFENVYMGRRLVAYGAPSPVLAITCLLIALYFFARAYHLDAQDPPEES